MEENKDVILKPSSPRTIEKNKYHEQNKSTINGEAHNGSTHNLSTTTGRRLDYPHE